MTEASSNVILSSVGNWEFLVTDLTARPRITIRHQFCRVIFLWSVFCHGKRSVLRRRLIETCWHCRCFLSASIHNLPRNVKHTKLKINTTALVTFTERESTAHYDPLNWLRFSNPLCCSLLKREALLCDRSSPVAVSRAPQCASPKHRLSLSLTVCPVGKKQEYVVLRASDMRN
jgi:hypothetical protein